MYFALSFVIAYVACDWSTPSITIQCKGHFCDKRATWLAGPSANIINVFSPVQYFIEWVRKCAEEWTGGVMPHSVPQQVAGASGIQLPLGQTWEFHVIENDEDVNAFVLPGGQVFVNTGLMNLLDDDNQLVSRAVQPLVTPFTGPLWDLNGVCVLCSPPKTAPKNPSCFCFRRGRKNKRQRK